MSGFAEIDAMIAKLHGLRDFSVDVAKAAAPKVEAVVKASAAAGTSPDGTAWKPKKRGGGRALPNASGAVSAVAKGTVISIVLGGVYVYHQNSKGHAREIIPDKGSAIPGPISAAIAESAREVFTRKMGGR